MSVTYWGVWGPKPAPGDYWDRRTIRTNRKSANGTAITGNWKFIKRLKWD